MAEQTIYADFNHYNSAPIDSDAIAVKDAANNFKGYIKYNKNYKQKLGNKLYTFGLFSDLHNNEGLTGNTTDNDEDMANAMSFYASNNVDFVACCGDVFSTANNSGMFQKFQQVKNANLGNIPFYSCSGNHDCATSTGDDGSPDQNLWNQYLDTNTSFVITSNENPSLPEDDVLIFFGERYNIFCNTGSSSANRQNPTVGRNPYSIEDVNWLREQLERYKDKRVFVFNHLFFPYTCDAQNAYVSSSKFFSPLLTKIASLAYMYQNTIWFNGHNHWAYKEQTGDKKANVYVGSDFATDELTIAPQIHVSSCGGTREVNMGDSTYRRNDLDGNSEGSIVEVYENAIVYKCISFSVTAQNYINKLLPIAQYTIPFKKKTIPNWEIFEITQESQLTLGNIGSSTSDGSVESNSKYVVLSDFAPLDNNKKYFLAISRPVAGRSSDTYLGNFATGNVNSLDVSDSSTTPRLCQLFFHIYNQNKQYLGYVLNPKDGYQSNYYFNDMVYFQDVTNLFLNNALGNIKANGGTRSYFKFRVDPGTNANTSVAAVAPVAYQITLISCTVDEWNTLINQ